MASLRSKGRQSPGISTGRDGAVATGIAFSRWSGIQPAQAQEAAKLNILGAPGAPVGLQPDDITIAQALKPLG